MRYIPMSKDHSIDVAEELASGTVPYQGARDTTALNSNQGRFMPGARLFLAGRGFFCPGRCDAV